jgi:hypothetical protein
MIVSAIQGVAQKKTKISPSPVSAHPNNDMSIGGCEFIKDKPVIPGGKGYRWAFIVAVTIVATCPANTVVRIAMIALLNCHSVTVLSMSTNSATRQHD